MAFGTIVQRRTPVLFAGRLRNKINICKVSPVQDQSGGTSLNVNILFANVWASVEATGGNEQLAAGSEMSTVTHQIVIRYIGAAPSWLALTNYLPTALVKDSNGNMQQPQGAGLSGAVVPVWNPTQGQTTQDGDPSTGITWLNLGPAGQRSAVTSAMQVQFQTRQFQILDVQNPDERNKMQVLMCVEINDSTQQPGTLSGGVG